MSKPEMHAFRPNKGLEAAVPDIGHLRNGYDQTLASEGSYAHYVRRVRIGLCMEQGGQR